MTSRPNIIWLTIDSIRADHTSVHGYSRKTTPELERIARSESATAIDNCISEGIWSLPVGTSILTLTYPQSHQTVAHGDTVSESLTTVAEALSQDGYKTHGVSGNPWFSEDTGMARGFDEFEYVNKSNLTSAGLLPFLKFVTGLNRYSAGYTLDTGAHLTDFVSLSTVKKWIDEIDRETPAFIYAHTEGAHTPYYPPDPFVDAFTDDIEMGAQEAREFVNNLGQNLHHEMGNGLQLTSAQREALSAIYDALILYLDSLVGDVYDTLQQADIGPTIFVVTSDHGDHLGEASLLSHKISLRDELLHVPMVVDGLDANSERLTQHIDIMQSALNTAGVSDEQFQGIPVETPREFAIAFRSKDYFDRTVRIAQDTNPDFTADEFHNRDANAIRTKKWKLIDSEYGTELFSLTNEDEDVSDDHPDTVSRMSNDLREWLDGLNRVDQIGRAKFDDEIKDQLSDLGYM